MTPVHGATFYPAAISTSAQALNLDWLKTLPIQHHECPNEHNGKHISTYHLQNSRIGCSTSTLAGKWEYRLEFVRHVLKQTIQNYPPKEPLALISIGSNYLMMEYLVARGLIEHGFQQLYVFPVDPDYLCDDTTVDTYYTQLFHDFRNQMEQVHQTKWLSPLPIEKLHFFSRAQNVAPYLQKHTRNANVLVLQCLPPYGEFIKGINQHKLPPQHEKDFIIGGGIVPDTKANAITFLPQSIIKEYRDNGFNIESLPSLPIPFFKYANTFTYLDWGCKIYSNGEFLIKFTGGQEHLLSKSIAPTHSFTLADGQTILSKDLFTKIQNVATEALKEEITRLKEDNPKLCLTQAQKTALLHRVKDIFSRYYGKFSSIYSCEYAVDCSDMLEALKDCTGPHRKSYALYTENHSSIVIKETEF